jgi:hypothetical protein
MKRLLTQTLAAVALMAPVFPTLADSEPAPAAAPAISAPDKSGRVAVNGLN